MASKQLRVKSTASVSLPVICVSFTAGLKIPLPYL